jgi:hypothetical protein
MLFLCWNPDRKRFEVWERFTNGASDDTRKIMDYQNHDGTALPVVSDTLIDLINRADTRKWPLKDRLKLWKKKSQEEVEAVRKKNRDFTESVLIEDYRYINGIPTFFMDPRSMPQWKSTFTPYQEKILRRDGHI